MKITNHFARYLDSRTHQGVTNISKLHGELVEQGYLGSYSSIYRFLKTKSTQQKYSKYKPSIRFETAQGEQAQVDWGSFGKIIINGRQERLYAFVYVLGYSRAVYVEFTIHQDLKTLEECHKNAFKELGIPKTILYDNMKTVVIRRKRLSNGYVEIHYNPAFRDFAKFYGFQIKACPPYWPRAKGKVEATVKYLRNNFWQGIDKKSLNSLEDLNQKVKFWLENVANRRKHRTTFNVPSELWEIEKPYLRFPDSQRPYQNSPFIHRYSTKDSFVQYKHNYYSVPHRFARKKLFIKEESRSGILFLDIYFEDQQITTHLLSHDIGKAITKEEHLFPTITKRKKIAKDIKEHKVPTRSMNYYDELITKSRNG